MNKYALRLTWFAVKAAELLVPIVWNLARCMDGRDDRLYTEPMGGLRPPIGVQ